MDHSGAEGGTIHYQRKHQTPNKIPYLSNEESTHSGTHWKWLQGRVLTCLTAIWEWLVPANVGRQLCWYKEKPDVSLVSSFRHVRVLYTAAMSKDPSWKKAYDHTRRDESWQICNIYGAIGSHQTKLEARAWCLDQWQQRWSLDSRGRLTARLIPCFSACLDMNFGEVPYTTQFLNPRVPTVIR